MRFLLLSFLKLLQYVIDVILWVVIGALLIRLGSVLYPAASFSNISWVVALRQLVDPGLSVFASWIGGRWPEQGGGKFLPLGLAILVWAVKVGVRRGLDLWRFQLLESSVAKPGTKRGRASGSSDGDIDPAMISDSSQTREQLLKQYRSIEKKLQGAQRRGCAFLNMDVVGSTKMKTGETATDIAASFQAYEELLRRIFSKNNAWKQAWTPDGVLIAFDDSNLATRAAQQVLAALKQFNTSENKLRMPFRVRCGLSEGVVAIFEDTNLATFSDALIDNAAHLQKDARPNALCLGEDVFNALTEKADFYFTGRVVDAKKVYEWSMDPLPQGNQSGLMFPATPSPSPLPPMLDQSTLTPMPPPFDPSAVRVAPRADMPAFGSERTMASSSDTTQARRTIGRYEIVAELGRGAMGAVYKAIDPQIGRTVALKVILPRGLSPAEMISQKERFYREARAAGKLLHPGIVGIYDVAEDSNGSPYLVMEYVEGSTLDQALSPGGVSQSYTFSQRLSLAIEIASALDYAHRHGVIHRDIKPANILMTREGHSKIADFGIAKLIGSQATVGGQVMGTPAFVSPEQLTGAAADARSDIFSLGVVLYWIFTGVRPFGGETLTAVSYKVVHAMPAPTRQLNWALPEDLDKLVFRCLAKDPAERYQTAEELSAALEALRDGRTQTVP